MGNPLSHHPHAIVQNRFIIQALVPLAGRVRCQLSVAALKTAVNPVGRGVSASAEFTRPLVGEVSCPLSEKHGP
jgi:hypothetical protein